MYKVRALLEFDVPVEVNNELRDKYAIGLASYVFEGLDIAINRRDVEVPLVDIDLVGMRVGSLTFGTLSDEEPIYSRADGRIMCTKCWTSYSRHPVDETWSWLNKLCDGSLVKL